MVNKQDGMPVPYGEEYNPAEHVYRRSFEKDLIQSISNHNESLTCAKMDYHFNVLKLFMNISRKITDGKRKDTIMAFICAYSFVERLNLKEINLEQITALAHVLNDNVCFDSDFNKSPLNTRHLNFVIKNVWSAIQNDAVSRNLTFTKGKFIYHKNLLHECGTGEKDETFLKVYRKEMRKLDKKGHEVDVYATLSQFEKSLTQEQITGINKKGQLYALIAKKYNVHINTATSWIKKLEDDKKQKGATFHNCPILILILLRVVEDCTFSKTAACIADLIANNQKITQSKIAILTGVSIRSIKTHCKEFKQKIQTHNLKIKTMKNPITSDLKQENPIPATNTTNKRWTVYKSILRANGCIYETMSTKMVKVTAEKIPAGIAYEEKTILELKRTA